MSLKTYLRCEKDHATSVDLNDRIAAVGQPCAHCGRPLLAEPERERPPRRRF